MKHILKAGLAVLSAAHGIGTKDSSFPAVLRPLVGVKIL